MTNSAAPVASATMINVEGADDDPSPESTPEVAVALASAVAAGWAGGALVAGETVVVV